MAFHQNHQKKPDVLYRSSQTVKTGDQFHPDLTRKTDQNPDHKADTSSTVEKNQKTEIQ